MNKNLESISQENVKKTYHFYAPVYNFLFGAILEPGRRALSKKVRALQPKSILEVGVGTGLLLSSYPSFSSIVGIDISEDMLQLAKKEAAKLSSMNIKLELMNAENLTFADHSFECVVLPYVLSVTPDPNKLVTEVRRVCKPNGIIIVLNHFSGKGFWWLLEKVFKSLAKKIGFRSEFSYEQNVLNHDWEIVKVDQVNLFGLSKLIVIRNT